MRSVYLDNNATTPVDPRVVQAMLPLLTEDFGNPSSMHRVGGRAAAHVERARAEVAGLIAARDDEIVFTSGGTEADNAALRGVLAARPARRHVVISAVEHHAILDAAALLEREGVEVTRVGVQRDGRLKLDELAGAIRADTALVSVMLANNETGVILPVAEAAAIAHARGVPLHTDAVQALGKIPVNVGELGIDLLSLSAHKIHGPKGAGGLYVRRGTPFRPMLIGGHQERDRRGGTHNTSGLAGLGEACAILRREGADALPRVEQLRDRLERGVVERIGRARVIGADAPRLPNTACIGFEGVDSEAVLLLLSEAGICASGGAACSSGSLEPSHVLSAMGVPPQVARGQVRFSVGRDTREEEMEIVLEALPAIVEKAAALAVS
jgi:cysteine desulfurase